MTNISRENRYEVVKRNGSTHNDYGYVTKEVAEEAVARSNKRGWGWTVREHTEEEMDFYVMMNAWYRGML